MYFLEVFMKKTLIFVLVLGIMPFLAFAHGHGRGNGHGHNYGNYSVCIIENCYEQGVHLHNDNYFSPHYFNDGHQYHQACGFNNCYENVVHTHNGHHYYPNNY
jgi:hypothetical protein